MASSSRRLAKWTLIGFLGLLLLAVLAFGGIYLHAQIKYSRALDREIVLADASGKPWRWAELRKSVGGETPANQDPWGQAWDILARQGAAGDPVFQRFARSGEPIDPADRVELETILKRHGPMFEAAERAATGAAFPPGFRVENGVPQTPESLRHYSHFIDLTLLKVALEPETAAELCRVLLALADRLESDPFPLSQEVKATIYNRGVFRIAQILLRSSRKEDVQSLLQDRLRRLDGGSSIELALRGQRALGAEFFESLISGKTSVADVFLDPKGMDRIQCFLSYPGTPWLAREYSEYLALERLRMEPAPDDFSRWLKNQRRMTQDSRGRKMPLLAIQIAYPPVEDLCTFEANLRIARYVLGLEQEFPLDPWGTGKVHARNDRGLRILWSIGPNGRDDEARGDDIVWRVP
jgi:hypothetical protein